MRTLRAIVLALVLLAAAVPPLGAALVTPPKEPPTRGPVRIEGDAAFTPENGVVGGSGTPEDPYVIRDHRILLTDQRYAVALVGTRAHAVVENVTVTGVWGNPEAYVDCGEQLVLEEETCWQTGGIVLEDAQNVTVRDFRYRSSGVGVWAVDSKNVLVEDVHLELFRAIYATAQGVILTGGTNLTLRDLQVDAEVVALSIRGATDVLVDGGRYSSGFYRVLAYDADGLVVRDADLPVGVYVESTENARIVGNDFGSMLAMTSTGSYGEARFHTRGILVCGNEWNVTGRAIGLVGVADARFAGNAFHVAGQHMQLETSRAIELFRNGFGAATSPSTLESTYDLVAHENSFHAGSAGFSTERWYRHHSGNMTRNWWGDASGPAPHGSGVPAPEAVVVDPWLTAPPADMHVDCDSEPTPAPLQPREHVIHHTVSGSSAIDFRWDAGPGFSYSVSRQLSTSDRAEVAWLDLHADENGSLARWSRGVMANDVSLYATTGMPDLVPLTPVVEHPFSGAGSGVSWGSTSCGASPCRGRAVHITGSSDPEGAIVITVRTTSEVPEYTMDVSRRAGLVTPETMDGPALMAQASPASVSVAALQSRAVAIEHELWGWSGNYSQGAGGETWARSGPDGQQSLAARQPVDLGGPAGTYVWRYTAARTGDARPIGLWADLDLPEAWKG